MMAAGQAPLLLKFQLVQARDFSVNRNSGLKEAIGA